MMKRTVENCRSRKKYSGLMAIKGKVQRRSTICGKVSAVSYHYPFAPFVRVVHHMWRARSRTCAPFFALQIRLTSYFLDSSIARPPPRTSLSRPPLFRLLRQNLPDDRCTKLAETNIGSDFSVIPPKFQPSFTIQICL